jgi:hypothetical protein
VSYAVPMIDRMYDLNTRRAALDLVAAGVPLARISRQMSISRAAIREWASQPERALAERAGRRCFVEERSACPRPSTYAYLLGQYLGDGYLVTSARVPRLRVACADAYPGIAAEVDAALEALSGNKPGSVAGIGCSDHYSYWSHWPCLFPQHGPGMKHQRPIVLAGWQQAITAEHPWPLIRGLIHSDGCRAINRVKVHGVRYAYPRYFFSNESADILTIMGAALDGVGVAWRYNRPNSISIARRDAVALMDEHIGPKR